MEYLFVFIIFLAASFIQGISGFGSAILSMAILPFIVPFKKTVIIVLFIIFIMNSQMAFRLRKWINYKLLLVPIIISFLGRYIGTIILIHYNEAFLTKVLAIILILCSLFFMFLNGKIKIKPSFKNGIIAGLISGILGGAFNTLGPPLVIYYLNAAKNKMEYSATFQASSAMMCSYSIILHFFYGTIEKSLFPYIITGGIAATIGSILGLVFFKKISSKILNIIIYFLLIILGILMFFK